MLPYRSRKHILNNTIHVEFVGKPQNLLRRKRMHAVRSQQIPGRQSLSPRREQVIFIFGIGGRRPVVGIQPGRRLTLRRAGLHDRSDELFQMLQLQLPEARCGTALGDHRVEHRVRVDGPGLVGHQAGRHGADDVEEEGGGEDVFELEGQEAVCGFVSAEFALSNGIASAYRAGCGRRVPGAS